jgi:hypothetical protein
VSGHPRGSWPRGGEGLGVGMRYFYTPTSPDGTDRRGADHHRTRAQCFPGGAPRNIVRKHSSQERLRSQFLKDYSESKGYVFLSQWAPIDVHELRTSWGVAPNTAIKYTEIAKSFFNYAVANKWIVKSSAKLIKGARGKAASNQRARIPFSDEELQRMYDACEHQYGQTP